MSLFWKSLTILFQISYMLYSTQFDTGFSILSYHCWISFLLICFPCTIISPCRFTALQSSICSFCYHLYFFFQVSYCRTWSWSYQTSHFKGRIGGNWENTKPYCCCCCKIEIKFPEYLFLSLNHFYRIPAFLWPGFMQIRKIVSITYQSNYILVLVFVW